MALVTLENLARYDGNAKDRAKSLYASASAANWQKTEKAGAVTCWPSPETPLEPVVEFLFTETLPEGTKESGNPSVISGVESVKVTRCGKNLVPYIPVKTVTTKGVTFSVASDGRITVNGTAGAGNANFDLSTSNVSVNLSSAIPVLAGYTYTVSGCPSGGSTSTYCMFGALYDKNGHVVAYNVLNDSGNGKSYTPSVDGCIFLRITITAGYNASNLVFSPQIEESSTATSYEPPERNLYTIDLNGTFYGGTLDVSTGKLTVTHRMVEPSSSETVDIADFPAKLPLDCTDTYGRTITSADGTSLSVGSSGGQIVYRLAVPYSVYIDAVKIPSLPALDIHSPRLNTIYTDALNVQVGYQKHPRRTEEEIQNAILALGGNV